MTDSVLRLESAIRIPTQATCDKVKESFVLSLQGLRQGLRARSASSALATDCDPWLPNRVEEELLPRASFNEVPIWWTKDFHDACKLLLFVLAGKEGIASPKLSQDAPERPHVNAQAIAAAKYDFRTAVESGLNIRIHFLLLFATTAKVDDSNIGFSSFAEQDVLGFEVAMNDALVLQQH